MATLPDLAPKPELAKATPSIGWSFSWSLLGNVVYALCQWCVLSLLAKLGSAAMVGQYALALAVTAPVFMLSNLQLRAVQVTDARGEHCFAEFAWLRAVTTALAMGLVVALSGFGTWDGHTRLVLLVVGFAKGVESFSDILGGVMQKAERLDLAAMSLLARGGLGLAAFWLIFSRRGSLVAGVTASVVASLIVLCAYDWPVAQCRCATSRFHISLSRVGKLARVSFPLGLVMALVSLNINIPRYFMAHCCGATELGIFASLGYVVLAINTIISALGQSVSVRLSRFYAEGEIGRFKHLVATLCLLGAAIGVIGVPVAAACGQWLLTILYRPEYAEQLPVFLLLIASAGFTAMGSFLGFGLTAARIFRAQLWMIGATALTTLIGCGLLVPRMGITGAATSVLLSSFVFAGMAAILLRHSLRRVRA